MKILVCIKQVPDTASKIVIKENSNEINTDNLQLVMNPYDEFAVEEALRIKEKRGGTEVIVITLGEDSAGEVLRTALAMGADRGYHIQDDAFKGSDNFVVASILAKIIRGVEFDLILTGKQAVDDDSFYVGQALAEMLEIPNVSVITELHFSEDYKLATVKRQIEGGSEIVEVALPALFTCQKDLNIPRLPSMKGIMSVKNKEVIKLDLEGIGLERNQTGVEGSLVKILSLSLPPERSAGKILKGSVEETSKELVHLLRNEAKII